MKQQQLMTEAHLHMPQGVAENYRYWGDDRTVDIRTVDQHVARLRRTLGFQAVETVPGVGYRIAAL